MSLVWPRKGIPSGHNLPDRSKSPQIFGRNCSKIGGIATPVCGLVRNDSLGSLSFRDIPFSDHIVIPHGVLPPVQDVLEGD